MKYTTLGSSNLKISKIGLGSMTWGEQNTASDAAEQMAMSLDMGVNFFDVAEMYPVPPKPETFGESERIMGDWLNKTGQRDKVILATKVTGASSGNRGVNYIRGGASLCKTQIHEACNASLKRLQTETIDLYQVHWPERATNFFGKLGYNQTLHNATAEGAVTIAETLEALTELVQQGKIRYIGISNETPWGMLEYLKQHWQKGFERIVSIQNPYNLLNRTFEVGCAEISLRENIGLLAYSPLAFGKLTGKYLNQQKPDGARLTLFERFTRYEKIHCDEATAAYASLALDNNISPTQLALAFVNQQGFLASNIIGATTLAQLKENISSIDITLSPEILSEIERLHQRYSNPAP